MQLWQQRVIVPVTQCLSPVSPHSSCFGLQAMHAHLVQLGVPKLTAAICQAPSSTMCSVSKSGGCMDSSACSPACQLQMAAAGYLTSTVQHAAAVEALGGPDATAQLLTSLLASCVSCRWAGAPVGVYVCDWVNKQMATPLGPFSVN